MIVELPRKNDNLFLSDAHVGTPHSRLALILNHAHISLPNNAQHDALAYAGLHYTDEMLLAF